MYRHEQYPFNEKARSDGYQMGVAAAREAVRHGEDPGRLKMPNFRLSYDDSVLHAVEDGWLDGVAFVAGGNRHIPARDTHRRKDVVRKGSKWEPTR